MRTGKERQLDAIYAELPGVACKGLCYQSCSFIAMSEVEHGRIVRETGKRVEVLKAPCPALDFAGRCSVYELRPMICRLYGVSEDMPCPHGCVPERTLTSEEARAFLGRVRDVGGEHDLEAVNVLAQLIRGAGL